VVTPEGKLALSVRDGSAVTSYEMSGHDGLSLMGPGTLSKATIADIIEWDVGSWSRALFLWDQALVDRVAPQRVLEIGSRRGGLTLYFALKGYRVVCSDLGGPSPQAAALHDRYGISGRVEYGDVDVTAIPYPDASFDIVAYKSVLGAIRIEPPLQAQRAAIREIYRVLKPGGLVLFAENLAASPLHRWLRRRLTRWGARWQYPTAAELRSLLDRFACVELRTFGFLAALGRSEGQRRTLHRLDRAIMPLVPTGYRYIGYGWARR
jgi:ubiquinone/menaquinone biosynthesis C-methylase UbiE